MMHNSDLSAGWSLPDAPLAMPRQVLELPRRRPLFSALRTVLSFARARL
jgi:hypothetical protein